MDNSHSQKVAARPARTAFTMVELTVVLAVIAMLLSALSAAGEKSRYHARRAICENNLRQQINFQLQYATDNSGNFAPFKTLEPWVVRDAARLDASGTPLVRVQELYKPYLGDSAKKLLVCPLTKIFASQDQNWFGYYADPAWISLQLNVGGWNAAKPDGSLPSYIYITYNWFMGFQSIYGQDYQWQWLDGETPWPKNLAQCSSTAAAGAHVFNTSANHGMGKFRNYIHGGNVLAWGKQPEREIVPRTGESPAAYSDGHVEQHQFESQGSLKLKTRVKFPGRNSQVAVAY